MKRVSATIAAAARPTAPAVIRPLASLVAMVIIAILPWGLAGESRFVLPMLPLVVIHYWTLDGRGVMPAGLIFVAGLVIDLVTRGPLGFWAAIYLISHMIAHWLSGRLSENAIGRWIGFVLAVILLVTLQWISASAYFVRWQDWQPFVIAAAVVTVFYPIVSLVMMHSNALKPEPLHGAAKVG